MTQTKHGLADQVTETRYSGLVIRHYIAPRRSRLALRDYDGGWGEVGPVFKTRHEAMAHLDEFATQNMVVAA